jgi:WD40 repeat protein
MITTKRHLVLTVHGIRTYGRWQERLEALLHAKIKNAETNIDFDARRYRYGFFTLFTFLLPFFRNLAVRNFKASLNAILDDGPYDRIDVVAHSFGTFLLVEALTNLGRSDDWKIHTVILCGSVLPPGRNLSQLVGPKRPVSRIVNECGMQDGVLLLTLPVYGVGMGGRLGLHGFEGPFFENRYFRIGHSGYFEGDGENIDAFMQRWWLPLLLNDEPIEKHNDRPEKASLPDRVWRTLGENGALVALSIYAAVVTGVIITLTNFWLAEKTQRAIAEQQRNTALRTSARLLSTLSERMVEIGDSDRAILLALASLDIAPLTYRKIDGKVLNQRLGSAVIAHRKPAKLTPTSNNGRGFVSFSPDGHYLVASNDDDNHAITLFDRDATSLFNRKIAPFSQYEDHFLIGKSLKGHSAEVLGCVFSPDSKRFVTWANDGTAKVWSVEHPEQNRVLVVAQDFVRAPNELPHFPDRRMWGAAFSPDSLYVATFSANNTAIVWDATTGEKFKGPFNHESWVMAGAFNKKADHLFTVSWHNRLREWNINTSAEESLKRPNTSGLAAATVFSHDVRHVVTTSGEKAQNANIWTVHPFELKQFLQRHTETIEWIEFSSDDKLVVTASGDHTARVWNVETGKEVALLKGHGGMVRSATFSSDGRFVLTASQDQSARVWDVSDGTQIAILTGHFGPLTRASISSDSNWVATSSTNQSFLYKIELPNEELVSHAHKSVSRCFSRKERIDLGLSERPPDWCIELEKRPYNSAEWRDWLQAKRDGRNPSPPSEAVTSP